MSGLPLHSFDKRKNVDRVENTTRDNLLVSEKHEKITRKVVSKTHNYPDFSFIRSIEGLLGRLRRLSTFRSVQKTNNHGTKSDLKIILIVKGSRFASHNNIGSGRATGCIWKTIGTIIDIFLCVWFIFLRKMIWEHVEQRTHTTRLITDDILNFLFMFARVFKNKRDLQGLKHGN
jgi:hypothetical protein